jgi:hypothetical protein
MYSSPTTDTGSERRTDATPCAVSSTQRAAHWLALVVMLIAAGSAWAQAPDMTQGGKKPDKPLIGNLGPTGMLGWVYSQRSNTSLSRQVIVTEVAKGSPAEGIMKAGDVILGADGTGAAPVKFSHDALRSFADAITDAEARNPAELKMLVWRDGQTTSRTLTIETMGAYSPTAPYNCPKSAKIIRNALRYIDGTPAGKGDRFGWNTLALIAYHGEDIPGDAKRLERARKQIIGMLPDEKHYKSMTSNEVERLSKIAWNRTYELIVLAEYYLATGDNPSNGKYDLLQTIDAYAQTITRGQSMFGTMGHQFALQGEDGSIHGPYGVGYGPINATGLAALYGLTLARECELPNAKTNAAIAAGIERAARFFSSYAGRGTIPYGEHGPWTKGHSSNGKAGLAAMALARVPGRETEAKYFSQVAIAGASDRHSSGHGGTFFNYMWTPLGANVGGVAAAAAHFRGIRWHLELSRAWDGGFYYNDYANIGYNGSRRFGKANLQMYTPALLTYATALKKLVMTGRELGPKYQLTEAEVAAASLAAYYHPAGRRMEQLVDDLGSFSATVRMQAAGSFAERPDAAQWLAKLHAIAVDPSHPARVGAIQAMGALASAESAPVLVKLFTDEDRRVREAAVNAFSAMPAELQAAQLDALLKMTAALRRPPYEVHDTDPMNHVLGELTSLLFDKKGILGSGLKPVEKYSSRARLYEAIRAAATVPAGGVRGKLKHVFDVLSKEDVKALGETILDLVYHEAPADAMFAENIRSASVRLLLEHRFAEGLQASIDLFTVGGRWTKVVIIREWAKLGGSLDVVKEGAEIKRLLAGYNDKKFKDEAKKALAAIAKDKKPGAKFTSLK